MKGAIQKAPRIETARLILRPMQPEDTPALLEYFCDPVASRYWFTPDRNLAEALARVVRLEADWKRNGFGDWAVVDKNSKRFIGFAGLHYITGMSEVNLGYFLTRSAWGGGLGTEACRAVLDFGFNTAGLDLVVGVTHPGNSASIRVLEKLGMKFWKDVVRDGAPRVVYSVHA